MAKAKQFPNVRVNLGNLNGPEGNGIVILGRVDKALMEAGVDMETRTTFQALATSGDYRNLLKTVSEWVVADVEYDETLDETLDDWGGEDE